MNSVKRYFVLLFAVITLLSLCACGEKQTTSENQPTAKEQLNESESILFDCLVNITTEYFYEPAAVRVLEIGDFQKGGFDSNTVVVRLQGENKLGGTLNHYYCIAVSESETPDGIKDILEADGFPYCAHIGDFIQLDDDYSISEKTNDYDFGKINQALSEYWKEKGF